MKKYLGWVVFCLSLAVLNSCSMDLDNTVTSPNGNLKISVASLDGTLQYSVSCRGEPLILNSKLGLTLKDLTALNQGLVPRNTTQEENDSQWEPVWGKRSVVIDRYNQLTVQMENSESPPSRLTLVVRAYDDGVAFRYEFPEQDALSDFEITSEDTEFVLASNFKCFALTRSSFKDSYEANYHPRNVAEIAVDEIIGLPLLIEADQSWMAITEANLTDYSGMSLSAMDSRANTLVSRLAPYPDDSTVLVKAKTPFVTPWRTILVGESAGQLIESDLIFNLNPPNALQDVSWIKPGVAIWPWWNNRISNDPKVKGGQPSTAIMKYYIDFAARHGIPNLVGDAGWYSLEMDAWNQPEKEDVLIYGGNEGGLLRYTGSA